MITSRLDRAFERNFIKGMEMGALVKTCIAFFCSNQNIDKTTN